MDSAERALAEEGRRNLEELLLTALRDGKERLASEMLPLVEAIASSFTGVGALPTRLDDERRQKTELTNALNRLKHAGSLQVQGTGAQRTVKLTNSPAWVVRDKQLLDHAEGDASCELLKLVSDGEWHLTDTLLSSLQDSRLSGVSEIGQFTVAHAALERALREGKCSRQTSGRKGTIDYTDEIKLAGPGKAPETDKAALGEGTRQADVENPGSIPSHPTDSESTRPPETQADHQTSSGDVGAGGLKDDAAEGGDATEAGAEQAPDLQLQAGFVPNGPAVEISEIDIDKIDLDDDEDRPLQEVEGLSESIDNLGLLELPGVRPGPAKDRYRPVFGRRRLRDCKKKGWKNVPCIVLRVDDRTAELAAIDENLVRHELTVLERAEYLRRRKQIYEELHPEAARPKGGRPRKNAATVAPFSEDAAQRTGASPRKVQLDIEIADKLTEPTKKVLRSTEFADQTTVLAKLAKLEPREQLSAAKLLAKGQATSVKAATRILEERRQGKGGAGETAEPNPSTPGETPEGGVSRASFEVLSGDCLSLLPAQTTGRFRLLFADPPQNDGVDYGEGSAADQLPDPDYLAWVKKWLAACVRLLTNDGSLWFLTRDRYVHSVRDLLNQVGLHLQSWIKVYEPPGVGSSQGFLSSTLHLLHSTKAANQFAFYREGLEQAVARSTAEVRALTALGCKPTDDVWIIPRLKATEKERIPSFPVQRRKALLQPVIRCATAAGDWVLDPFSGSATTGVVALAAGCNYLGIEKNVQFAEQSRGRLTAAVQPGDKEVTGG